MTVTAAASTPAPRVTWRTGSDRVAHASVARAPRTLCGDLVKRGEALSQALARLERRKDYAKVIGGEDGQRLLEAINAGGGDVVPVPVP